MEVVYEHPFLTTWFIGWTFFCLSSVVSIIKIGEGTKKY